jgi:DNA invertase Pin-like site-specific DNA recombinase
MSRMIDSFAEYERLIIASRTRSALAAKRRKGERTSRLAPFGFQLTADCQRVERCESEQQTLQTMQTCQADGRSLRTIARDPNEMGSRTHSGMCS